MLHPQAHELRDVLMGFLLESGNQIVQIETATAASL
jgi:hypothetical protein